MIVGDPRSCIANFAYLDREINSTKAATVGQLSDCELREM